MTRAGDAVTWRERRRARKVARAAAREAARRNGTVVHDVGHLCRPPSARRGAGEWVVGNEDRYPEGTVWRCDCGLLWVSSMNNGPWGRRGLWLTWERPFMRDREYVERLGLEDEHAE